MQSNQLRWRNLLTTFSQTLIQNRHEQDTWELTQEMIDQCFLGYAGASDAQIQELEDKLGVCLPPSYKGFLKVTDGWRECDWSEMRLLGTDEIDWLRNKYPGHIEAFEPKSRERPSVTDKEYFVYGDEQDSVLFRVEYLFNALSISSECWEGDILVLIPDVKTDDGEWEAWWVGYKLPGAMRFRSFREMMLYIFEKGQLI
ncbi:MAG: SMI1/KNR4 family protein [Pseudanabaena sp.]